MHIPEFKLLCSLLLVKMEVKDRDHCCGFGWLSLIFLATSVYLSWDHLKYHPESAVTPTTAPLTVILHMIFFISFHYGEPSASTAPEGTVELMGYLSGLIGIMEATPHMVCIYQDYPQWVVIYGVLAAVFVTKIITIIRATTCKNKNINNSTLPIYIYKLYMVQNVVQCSVVSRVFNFTQCTIFQYIALHCVIC